MIAVDNTVRTTKEYSVKPGEVKNKRAAIYAERRVKTSRAGGPHAKRRDRARDRACTAWGRGQALGSLDLGIPS